MMGKIPTESTSEIRRRFCDLARILENHNVAWTYDLLIDLDFYMASRSRPHAGTPQRTQ